MDKLLADARALSRDAMRAAMRNKIEEGGIRCICTPEYSAVMMRHVLWHKSHCPSFAAEEKAP